jgi:aryl sulfotransferase
MSQLIRGSLREARSQAFDSALWADYKPRPGDIIIATYPKCGTTWTQRIVGMLIFQSDAPFPVHDISPWPDFRLAPPGVMLEIAESQTHRRFLKSHLPLDSLPIYEGVKIIHVARDGRDAAMSFYNHKVNYTDETISDLSEILLADPKFGVPFQRIVPDPVQHFHNWVSGDEDHFGDPACGFFYMENSYWAARDDANLLLVHYSDMKKDIGAEMRRIALFLDIEVEEALWPKLIKAAGFDAMKEKANELLPEADAIWQGGGNTFLHKGTNGRWRGTVSQVDLEAYDAKVKNEFSPELAQWCESGRLDQG